LLLGISVSIAPAQSANPQETLNQYVSDLQKNPSDYALREKIIKHVQTMRPAPAIPEEARRNYVMGLTLFRDTKNIQDYNDSIEKFKTAVLIAPWWVDAYRDMGMALKAAERYSEAINALRLYIAANPDSDNARKAQDEIYIIEAKKEKTAKESSPEAIATKKHNEFEALLRKIDGRRYTYSGNPAYNYLIDVQGKYLVVGLHRWGQPYTSPGAGLCGRIKIQGPESVCSLSGNPEAPNWLDITYIISEDGETITQRSRFTDGTPTSETIYRWKR
jgi:tetratricopeptide (TPR) repeat protein